MRPTLRPVSFSILAFAPALLTEDGPAGWSRLVGVALLLLAVAVALSALKVSVRHGGPLPPIDA